MNIVTHFYPKHLFKNRPMWMPREIKQKIQVMDKTVKH